MPSYEAGLSFDWAPDAILVVARSGRILDANARARELFGYRRDELADRPVAALIDRFLERPSADTASTEPVPTGEFGSPEPAATQPEAAKGEAQPATAIGPLHFGAFACTCRDGRRFPASLHWHSAPAGGAVCDIVSIREADDALEQRAAPARERSALQQQRDFLTLFNHDVRQSLQSIQFLCDSLTDTAPQTAAVISEIVASLKKLLDTVLRLSEATPLTAAEERCVLGDLLGALGRELQPLAERKRLELVIDPANEELRTDPVLLRELLQNLMVNAIRYTKKGSVRVQCSSEPSVVRIDVVDTGVGMDGEALRDLLAGRESAAVLPTRPGTGSGIGLAIARRLADVLGCRIEAASTPGEGSRFSVVAPRAAGSQGGPASAGAGGTQTSAPHA